MSKNATLLIILLIWIVVAGTLSAQDDRGNITGTVTDQGGAVIPNAVVTATHLGTNIKHKTTTNESGEFSLPSLAVGDYRVDVETTGFKTAIHQRSTVAAGSTVRLNTKLELGTVQQSVEVSGNSAALLQMDDGKLKNDIPYQLIQGLPTVVSGNMRSPFDLANLTPGVEGTDQDVRIGGGQQAAWGATLDGGSVAGNRLGSAVWSGVN